jgi:Nuclease-related domain
VWVLLRGYRNRRGEINHLLLGPGGLLAIEVQNRNGVLSCAEDRWWITRYDRYGNRISAPEPLTDRGGRSPSEQLNRPAGELAGFLSSRGQHVAMERVVWFPHPRAWPGACTSPTVHIVFSAGQVLRLLRCSPAALSDSECADVERLIIRDDRHHAARRAPRGSPRGQPPGSRTR